jgi:hypothetical protein
MDNDYNINKEKTKDKNKDKNKDKEKKIESDSEDKNKNKNKNKDKPEINNNINNNNNEKLEENQEDNLTHNYLFNKIDSIFKQFLIEFLMEQKIENFKNYDQMNKMIDFYDIFSKLFKEQNVNQYANLYKFLEDFYFKYSLKEKFNDLSELLSIRKVLYDSNNNPKEFLYKIYLKNQIEEESELTSNPSNPTSSIMKLFIMPLLKEKILSIKNLKEKLQKELKELKKSKL